MLQWRKIQDVLELEGAGLGEEGSVSRNRAGCTQTRGDKSMEN